MPHSFQPSVVAAEIGSKSGRVFLTEADRWTEDLAQAELIEDEAHADIRLLDAARAGHGATGIRLVRVRLERAGLRLADSPEFA